MMVMRRPVDGVACHCYLRVRSGDLEVASTAGTPLRRRRVLTAEPEISQDGAGAAVLPKRGGGQERVAVSLGALRCAHGEPRADGNALELVRDLSRQLDGVGSI